MLLASVSNATEEHRFQWTLVLLCWSTVLVALGALVVRTVQRGRKLARQVPEEQRRWM
ncbi:MAG: hypothetical protein WKF43_06155 [Acidimicrobiales bacterium]